VLGPAGFVITMAVDTLKGAVAMGLALKFGLADWAVALAALAVVTGHVFPAQLGFRGGKGLSPALGCLLVFDYHVALALLALAGVASLLTRQITLGLMAAIAAAPLLAGWLGHGPIAAWGWSAPLALIWYSHRENIAAAFARLRGQDSAWR
jgi:glycerol-3-phosphate acyltransferase PlsY